MDAVTCTRCGFMQRTDPEAQCPDHEGEWMTFFVLKPGDNRLTASDLWRQVAGFAGTPDVP